MDAETKKALGTILAELYATQNAIAKRKVWEDEVLFRLRHGHEDMIDDRLLGSGLIPKTKIMALMKIFTRIQSDPKELAEFRGFYDIEDELSKLGIDRGMACSIMSPLAHNKLFPRLFKKMNSSHSPVECKDLGINW